MTLDSPAAGSQEEGVAHEPGAPVEGRRGRLEGGGGIVSVLSVSKKVQLRRYSKTRSTTPYRGYLVHKKTRPSPRTVIGPWGKAFHRVLGGGVVLSARYPRMILLQGYRVYKYPELPKAELIRPLPVFNLVPAVDHRGS